MLASPRNVTERRRLAHLSLAAAISFAALAAALLYHFPPAAYGFYPLCPVHEYLHLECPGCGTTRALAALLHGHLGEAVRLNALAICVVLPAAAIYGLASYSNAVRGQRAFRLPQLPTPATYTGVVLIAAFTVLRNL